VRSSPAPAASRTTGTHTERVLVGGVGYRNLRDLSIGPWVADELAGSSRDGLDVEDVSYHPVGLSQNLQDRPPYDRVVLVGAVARGRTPGTVESYRWDGKLPEREQVQQRVSEAVTGVISLENTLIVCGALGGLPADVRVVEVEPEDQGWGEGFSRTIEATLPKVVEAVWSSTRP
jgi:hydrogenase maturation protease